MKNLFTTRGHLITVDDDDYDWLSKYKWYADCSHRTIYAVKNTKINGIWVKERMHRMIMKITDNSLIDHIDGNGLNNQKSNLRICADIENRAHRRPNNGHKYIGVGTYKSIYRSRIRINNIVYYLGYYKTAEEAALAYNEAAIKFKGEFAYLNDIPCAR